MAAEGLAGNRDGFLVERRGDHGVGFAAHAKLDGAANVGDGGGAVLGTKLTEGNMVIGGEGTGPDQRAGHELCLPALATS